MKIRVRLFAGMRLDAGVSGLEIELPDGATVEHAVESVCRLYPALRSQAQVCLTAVGLDYAPPERVLEDGEEVSLIPPVQGG